MGLGSKDLTQRQIGVIQAAVGPMLRDLGRLVRRMDQTFDPADPLLAKVRAAYDAVHALRVELHYLGVDAMKREKG